MTKARSSSAPLATGAAEALAWLMVMLLRERLGEPLPMPEKQQGGGRLLRKRVLRAWQQVLLVSLGRQGQVVPSHQGHQVRILRVVQKGFSRKHTSTLYHRCT